MEYLEMGGLIIIVFVGLPILLGLLFYYVPKKLGFPIKAKYLTLFYGLIVLTVTLFIVFEDNFFTKNDAKKLLEEQEIFLADNYDLLGNESISGIGEYYHSFNLKISDHDKQEIIKNIINSKYFKTNKDSIADLQSQIPDGYNGPKIVQNYETENSFVREYYKPNEYQGYAPVFRRISISKTENKLNFEDIDE